MKSRSQKSESGSQKERLSFWLPAPGFWLLLFFWILTSGFCLLLSSAIVTALGQAGFEAVE